ncbi:hypothetical protein ACVW00_004174 [Marmoricola sp. URHA0025 HA25]
MESALAIAAMLLSVLSVVVSGWFSARTVRLSHELDAERDQREEQRSALQAASRVYEPLAQAAAELQSRIYNIVSTGWVGIVERYQSHGDYAETSTAFLFAHYFGWVEARRQAVLTSSGAGDRDAVVIHAIDHVRQIMRRTDHEEGFLFYQVEQRAIGELMFSWDAVDGTGARLPHVDGYAAFSRRYREDPEFRRWFHPVDSGLVLVAAGQHHRLIEIHGALLALITVLDPTRKFTARYDLVPIQEAPSSV